MFLPQNTTFNSLVILERSHESLFRFISYKTMFVFDMINLVVLGTTVAVFGIIANIINIVVFLKQGFSDTVNVSLFALALSDCCSLITLIWVALLKNPLFNARVPFLLVDVHHFTGGWPHAFCARMTSWITAYITLERCLCVLIPLKVKRLITPKLAVVVLVSIFVLMVMTIVPDYVSAYLGWKIVPKRNNATLLGLLFIEGRPRMGILTFKLSAYTQIVSFAAVLVFTVILVVKMREKSRWRESTASRGQSALKGSVKRDNRIVMMIILIATIYCICLSPMLICYLITHFVPEFSIFGEYQPAFFVIWSFSFLLDSVNSAINIIVYYRMSTKYRGTFHELLQGGKLKKVPKLVA